MSSFFSSGNPTPRSRTETSTLPALPGLDHHREVGWGVGHGVFPGG
ncbi:MAG: hypothetical protein ACUVRX_05545 [Actinomycetota bacterium]